MNDSKSTLLVCLLALIVLGCAGSAEAPYERVEGHDHPLAGRIWDVSGERFVDRTQFMAHAKASEYVLLGEVHVNPEHHRLQVEVLDSLAETKQPPVVFEMIDRTQQHSIDAARAERPGDADYIEEVTRFEERGWRWKFYRPLVELALERQLAILGGNASDDQVRDVARQGFGALEAQELEALGLSEPLPGAAHADLVARIVEGHCGHLSPEMAERLVPAQRIKDASMAEVLRASQMRPAVLIAGSGHVRSDYGVPYYLRQREPDARVLALGFVEVRAGYDEAAEYFTQSVGQAQAFDYLWFTPGIDMGDPCERFKEGLERLKQQTAPQD